MSPIINKSIVCLLILAISFGTGYYLGADKDPVVEVKTEIVEKIVEVEVEKTKVNEVKTVIITEKPDGTKETKIESRTDTETSTVVNKESKKDEKIDISTKNNYRLGISARSDLDFKSGVSYEINGSRRLFGDIWLDTGFNINKKDVSIGLSYQF